MKFAEVMSTLLAVLVFLGIIAVGFGVAVLVVKFL